MSGSSSPGGGRSSRRRVLHLIKSLSVIGGAENLLLSVASAGSPDRFDYHVAHVMTKPWEDLVKQLSLAGVSVHSLGASSHYDPRWLPRLRRLLVEEDIELVHVHLPYTAALGRLVVRTIPDRPSLVNTEHSVWPNYALITRALHRATYRLDDADLAVSNAVRTALPRAFQSRTEVLVHGLPLGDFTDFAGDVRSEFGVGPEEVLVTTVANLRKEKGYDVLLRAAHSLVSEGLPVRFLAIGDGPLAKHVEKTRNALGLEERFVLTGFRSDAVRIVAGSDIFVLASFKEGFPISVMEALAVGVPVVSTAVGDLPTVIGDSGCGLIVPPNNPEALAEAIRVLARDPVRRVEMAKAARATGAQFDIRGTASRLEQVYDSLLGSPPADQ